MDYSIYRRDRKAKRPLLKGNAIGLLLMRKPNRKPNQQSAAISETSKLTPGPRRFANKPRSNNLQDLDTSQHPREPRVPTGSRTNGLEDNLGKN